jgi:hypothetical protein
MLKNRLVLPHNTGEGVPFWTGVCLFNPNGYSVTVTALPYDGGGRPREDLLEELTIRAGEKEIFAVHSKFVNLGEEIAYIVFEAEAPSVIGGFYLFGNMVGRRMSVEMLTGANM